MEKKDLEKMTVTKLREEALKYPEEIKAVHGMSKEQLVPALMKVLGIPEPKEDDKAAPGQRVRQAARSKAELKKRIRGLREERTRAGDTLDKKTARALRRRIHSLKRLTRKAAAAG